MKTYNLKLRKAFCTEYACTNKEIEQFEKGTILFNNKYYHPLSIHDFEMNNFINLIKLEEEDFSNKSIDKKLKKIESLNKRYPCKLFNDHIQILNFIKKSRKSVKELNRDEYFNKINEFKKIAPDFMKYITIEKNWYSVKKINSFTHLDENNIKKYSYQIFNILKLHKDVIDIQLLFFNLYDSCVIDEFGKVVVQDLDLFSWGLMVPFLLFNSVPSNECFEILRPIDINSDAIEEYNSINMNPIKLQYSHNDIIKFKIKTLFDET